MRVTDNGTYATMQRLIQTNTAAVSKTTVQLSSGNILQNLGDDPMVMSSTLRHDREESKYTQLASNQTTLTNLYNLYETYSQTAYSSLSSFKATLVKLSNTTESSADAKSELLAQIKSTREQLLELANKREDGQAIFGGAITDQDPYSADGVYHGDSTVNQVEVLPNVYIDGGITGQEVFGGANGGANVFTLLNNLENAVTNGTDARTAAADSLNDFTSAIDTVSYAQIKIGVGLSRITTSDTTLDTLKTNLSSQRENTESIDYSSAIMDYKANYTALQAALETNSKMLSTSLLDYLS